jgi:DHA2 family multidrug resistance protein
MWLGVPQLLVMPLLPWAMKKLSLKSLATIGILLFAYSNYLNAFMDFNYAGDQVRLSLLIRALGQPLFVIPISAIGMSLVNNSSAGNASSLFNMMRNLGGSIGVAMSGTFLITNQQEHLQNLTEKINPGHSLMGEYLIKAEYGLRSLGVGIDEAKVAALKSIFRIAYRDSFIQSFNDIFITLALTLMLSLVFIGLLKNVKSDSANLEIH